MREDATLDLADQLVQKIRHFIITTMGKPSDAATVEEFYHALCQALREEIMLNWTTTLETIEQARTRMVYFLSMEYLPGRFTACNLQNIGSWDLIRAVLKKMNRSLEETVSCEPDPGLGNGGLGRLSSCFLDSLASLHYPARAYGLRYQYGIFEQEIWGGRQVEKPDCWLLTENPWEQRRDAHATTVLFHGKMIPGTNCHGDEVFLLKDPEEVRALPFDLPIVGFGPKKDFSVLTLRLWSTKESPRNFQLQRFNAGFLDQAAENTTLTDVLYPNDHHETGKRIRLKQEFLLVSASLKDIFRRHMRIFGDMSEFQNKARIQINDTHPALVIAELVRSLMKSYDFSWKEAWEVCQQVCSYTNHTILREGLEEWNEKRVADLLPRQYNIIQKLNLEFCEKVRARFPGDEERIRRMSIIESNQIRMAHLAIVGSHKTNGVARLHGEILKNELFHDFSEFFPDRFTYITNGVTHRRWLLTANPRLAAFLTKRIGSGWMTHFQEIRKIERFASDPESQKEFLEIKKENKEQLIRFLTHENNIRDRDGKIVCHSCHVNSNALFDVQIKRIHEYKRQLLNALHLIMLYQELLINPEACKIHRLVIFGGKAAPGYERAKQILLLLSALGRKFKQHPVIQQKLSVTVVENYNVSRAQWIIPAADLSEQISLAGWEASGTGNMKLAINGALTIGTEDGANIEMRESVGDAWWPFRFGASAEQNKQPYQSWEIYLHNEKIRKAVDALKDRSFSETPEEEAAFAVLHRSLTEGVDGNPPDRFRVFQDLQAYAETQKRVEELFLQPLKWAEFALHNIAGMGPFSTDESIRNYAEKIWGIQPLTPDPLIRAKVEEEYFEHDRCRIPIQKGR